MLLHAKVHAPPEQAGDALATLVVQAVAEPHAPFAAQLSTLEPEHVVCPGAHTPVHPLVPEHVWFTQADAPLHVPLDWQVSALLPEHIICPGAHTPVHAPETQAWLLQAVAFCQVPVVLHVWGWVWLLHCVCPCAQTPWHAPETHVSLSLEHAAPLFCQAPLVPQVCGCCALHCAPPGVQVPVHTPLTHAWFTHATAVFQLPPLLQVCTLLPEHDTAPGVHVPVHTPATHAELVQADTVPHCPFD